MQGRLPERPERVVLLIIGGLFDRMAPVLWVLAVLSNLTVIHRMIYTWRETKQLEDAQRARASSFGRLSPSKPTLHSRRPNRWQLRYWRQGRSLPGPLRQPRPRDSYVLATLLQFLLGPLR